MPQTKTIDQNTQLLTGAILGTAVGDAIGLPREGLSRKRARKIFGDPPLHHALIAHRGMTSDDTEHTCMTAQALIASHGQPNLFIRSLSWRLRGWLLGLPAGVGLATAKATIKLWLGFGPSKSGVYSAGNGPAMRADIIGIYAKDNIAQLIQLVKLSTRLTHIDPAAEAGALAVALAAAFAAAVGADGIDPQKFITFASPHLADTPMLTLLHDVADQVAADKSLQDYLQSTGQSNGISGYINHTVPAAIFCWLKWPIDFRQGVEQIVIAGGDTDTTAAIVGALIAITSGAQAIPSDWLASLIDWPRNISWMKRLASTLASDIGPEPHKEKPLPLFWPGLLLRNVIFLLVVILHGVRRALPPY